VDDRLANAHGVRRKAYRQRKSDGPATFTVRPHSLMIAFRAAAIPERSRNRAGTAAEADSAPDIFTAVQDQLGPKLERKKGPVDVVIRHAQDPRCLIHFISVADFISFHYL